MLCFIARGRMSAIAKRAGRIEHTIQDSADLKTRQIEQEEHQTHLSDKPKSPVSINPGDI